MGRERGGRTTRDDAETCDRTATCETTGLHPSVQASGPEGRAARRERREAERGRATMSAAVARVAESKSAQRGSNERAEIRAIADGDALMRGNMDMRDLWVLADV